MDKVHWFKNEAGKEFLCFDTKIKFRRSLNKLLTVVAMLP